MTNEQAKAYAVLALNQLGYKKTEIEKVLHEMDAEMDLNTEEGAVRKAKKMMGWTSL